MGGVPGGFDMNNPFMMGLMSLFASQNPQTAGPALDQMGIPPPMGLTGGGADMAKMMQPQQPSMGGEQMAMGGEQTMQPLGAPPAAPTAAPTAAGGPTPQQLSQLAAMGGVKAPQPIQPIMNGGVTGGVKPPEVQLGGGFGTGVPPGIAMLLQSMASGQRQNPLIAPDLGSLVRGRG